MMNDTYKSILGLRAIREYKDQPLSSDDLDRILEAGRWTGSSKNRQDWSFVVIDDEEGLQAVAEHGDFTQPIRDSVATIVLVQEPGGNMFDIGRAAQNVMLAADAIGVASCPITLHRSDDAREHIGAPEGSVVKYAVALGYPAEGAEPRHYGGRKRAAEVVKKGSY
jgi:nitroreductase